MLWNEIEAPLLLRKFIRWFVFEFRLWVSFRDYPTVTYFLNSFLHFVQYKENRYPVRSSSSSSSWSTRIQKRRPWNWERYPFCEWPAVFHHVFFKYLIAFFKLHSDVPYLFLWRISVLYFLLCISITVGKLL